MWHLVMANTVRLPRADLDPRAEMNPSLGWNRLLMGHGSWRGWIRLWPVGLNWHFGAKTDLYKFQCTTWKWVGSVISENQQASFMTEWNFWYGSKLRKKISLLKQTDPYATTEAGKLRTWTRRTKSAKKPIQSNSYWIGWFLIYMRNISYWLKLLMTV